MKTSYLPCLPFWTCSSKILTDCFKGPFFCFNDEGQNAIHSTFWSNAIVQFSGQTQLGQLTDQNK